MKKLAKHTSLAQKLRTQSTKYRGFLMPAVFVCLFALVGVLTLLQSRAAIGNDLVVTSVSMNPTAPASGQAVTFTAVVKNQGTSAVPAGTVVGVAFYVDNVKVSWNQSNTTGLAAGASVTLTANAGTPSATWTATTGPHTVRAVADDNNVIPDESNEANNSTSVAITVGNTGNLYISPATKSMFINTNVTIAVRLTPGTTVDGVEATITYDATKLTYVSTDSTGSPFDIALGAQTGGAGTVKIARGNLNGGVATDSLVANVTFTAIAGSGTTTLQVAGNATKAGAYTNPVVTNSTITLQTPDTTAPATAITAPAVGSSLFGSVTVSATASDAVGVTKVEFYIDNQLIATDTTSPYGFTLDTTKYSSAVHNLQTKAYDAAGNVGSSNTAQITIKNWAEDINQDGAVNLLDFSILAGKFGQTGTALGRADINGDQIVNLQDFSLLASKFGQ